MQINLEAPSILIVLCALLGLGYAAALYFKSKKFKATLNITLAAIRFTLVAAICILLLSPVSNYWDQTLEKPIVLWLQDNSTSVAAQKEAGAFAKELQSNIQNLRNSLAGADVELVTFDEELHQTDSIHFNGTQSNLSAALKNINQLYKGKNVAALVLATDGIYNQGYNPRYEIVGIPFPIFTYVLGDTTTYTDGRIEGIRTNKIAYKNNQFPIEVDVFVQGTSKTELELSVWQNNKKIKSKKLSINQNPTAQKHSFLIEAQKAGLAKYQIKLAQLNNEQYLENNSQQVLVEIVENKKKILVVSEMTHPDVHAIIAALQPIEEYEIKTVKPNEVKASIQDQNLVVFYQYPSKSTEAINPFLKDFTGNKLMVFGRSSDESKFNSFQSSISINNKVNIENATVYNPGAPTLFALESNNLKFFESMPPLAIRLNKLEFKSNFEHIYLANVLGIETQQPVMSLASIKSQKVGFINAEGFWRWRVYDFKKHQNTEYFDVLFRKMIRFLVTSEILERFKLEVPKTVLEGQTIKLEAEIYNQAFESISSGNVDITFTNKAGKAYKYTFLPDINFYTLNINGLPQGEYTYLATAELGKERFTKTGQLIVAPLFLEMANLKADYALLRNMAQDSKGEVFMPSDFELLNKRLGELSLKPKLHSTLRSVEWINFKWILVLILLLLGVEWFLRKYNGAY